MSIFDKGVCYTVTLSKPGSVRKASTDKIDTDADKNLLRLSKRLFDCKEFDAIGKIDGRIRSYLMDESLAHRKGTVAEVNIPIFKGGVYFIPYAMLEDVEEKVAELVAERRKAIDTFIAVYPAEKERAKQRLASMYNESQYLSSEELRDEFTEHFHLTELSAPGNMKKYNKERYAAEAAKFEAELHNAADEMKLALRAGMLELINHLVEGLEKKQSGQKGARLADPTVDKVTDFLDNFEKRDIFDDVALKGLVAQAKDILKGKDDEFLVDSLRNDSSYRGGVIAGLKNVGKELKQIAEKPRKRQMELD